MKKLVYFSIKKRYHFESAVKFTLNDSAEGSCSTPLNSVVIVLGKAANFQVFLTGTIEILIKIIIIKQ